MQDVDWCMDWAGMQDAITTGNMFFTLKLYKRLSISELVFQDATFWYNAICYHIYIFFTTPEFMQDLVDWCMDWAGLHILVNLLTCSFALKLKIYTRSSELAFQDATF